MKYVGANLCAYSLHSVNQSIFLDRFSYPHQAVEAVATGIVAVFSNVKKKCSSTPYRHIKIKYESKKITSNKPYIPGKELPYITQALQNMMSAGDGPFARRCHASLEQTTGCSKALLTHSCTAALEMAEILADIQPGDEVITPSCTFIFTANTFVLPGGVPVLVDIRPDTLNVDETLMEAAIRPRTKVIVPVHHTAVACEMDIIMATAERHHLVIV